VGREKDTKIEGGDKRWMGRGKSGKGREDKGNKMKRDDN
jgi:hypothetical protein